VLAATKPSDREQGLTATNAQRVPIRSGGQ
jgi:hypothetical protein